MTITVRRADGPSSWAKALPRRRSSGTIAMLSLYLHPNQSLPADCQIEEQKKAVRTPAAFQSCAPMLFCCAITIVIPAITYQRLSETA